MWLSHLLTVAHPLSNCTLTLSKGGNIRGENRCISPVVVRHSTCVILSHVPHNIIPIVPAEENGIVDLWES